MAKNRDRLAVAGGAAVCAGRGDRVERVGDRHDPRPEGDLVAGEVIGIAGAVESLVVMADDRRQRRVAERGDHLGAVDRVALDHIEFLIRQPPRLVQDLLRGAKLADVMDRGGCTDPRDFLARQAHPARDHRGVPSDPVRVTVEVQILTFERAGELAQQLLVAADVHLLTGMCRSGADEAQELGRIAELVLLAAADRPSPQQQLAE